MAFKNSLYPVLICITCLLGAHSLCAQTPQSGTAQQRISGGVMERNTGISDSVVKLRLQSPIFKDTLPISRVAALSVVVPGFAQLYNNQYWKIPILYGAVGGFSYLTINANKNYQRYKRQFDFLMLEYNSIGTKDVGSSTLALNAAQQKQFLNEEIYPVREKMNKYNAQRTIYFAGAAATYLYFMADGVLKYPNQTTSVKRATTLAMMFPGAGQLYNKSYWKVPIVVGGFATIGYMIDWNNRMYQRFRTAYNNPGNNEFTNKPGYAWLTVDGIQKRRDQARRNRDLCIIVAAGFYLLTVADAHVDAHMKGFDISDDLTMRVEPSLIDMSNYYSENYSGYPGVGLALKLNF